MTHSNSLSRGARLAALAFLAAMFSLPSASSAQPGKKAPKPPATAPAPGAPLRVYVPYKELQKVFEKEGQGVFLPYTEFQRLWRAAQGKPAAVAGAPSAYLVSTARFSGSVSAKLATMSLDLTVDILAEGWVEIPVGLGEVAVAGVKFAGADAGAAGPLLRVVNGQYVLLAKGTGRKTVRIDFVRQLVTQPGLNVLSFRVPSAAISTLDLTIPEENMKVDVEPMLAATTTQKARGGKKVTALQAFLGSARSVKLSWKPTTQAAAELKPVVICEQFQHIHVDEALVRHEITLNYDIRRRGVGAFTVQLPGGFRVTSVDGANIAKWDLAPGPAAPAGKAPAPQLLQVALFSPVKDSYTLTVHTERFLKESTLALPLRPVVTRQVLRRTGLIAITRSSRRSVELRDAKDLARVDTGRLPKALRGQTGATAYRFITADYGATLAIGTLAPRIQLNQLWALGVADDHLELRGRLSYRVDRAGVFQVKMLLPAAWEVVSVGPDSIVDDHQLARAVGKKARPMTILLKQERTGSFAVDVVLRAPRPAADADVDFTLPLADAENLQLYTGQLLLCLTPRFRAEIAKLDQLQSLPTRQAVTWTALPEMVPAMAFQFRAPDRAKPAGASFKIAVKPAQVLAVVHRLIDIQPGWVEQDAVVDFSVLYAPVDTFYIKMPAALADQGVQIQGEDIKEKPRIPALPPEALPAGEAGPATKPAQTRPAEDQAWAYYKIVLQAPIMRPASRPYRLTITGTRQRRRAATQQAVKSVVGVDPILAAGAVTSQSGHIAVAKADTLAIGQPVSKNLQEADPASSVDLPYAPHRQRATLAFKYNAPPYELSLPVVTQAEAYVPTTIANAAVIEQVLGRDGRLSARATFALSTQRGNRLPFTLPAGAQLFSVLINGAEAPIEPGTGPDERIVRLPPSAGATAKLVLEIAYGQDKASRSLLAAPALAKDVPVQQTLWRLSLAGEDVLLGHDQSYALTSGSQAAAMLRRISQDMPAAVEFKLPVQGVAWYFQRQAAPRDLKIHLADREIFHLIVWGVVVVLGVLLLKCGGYCRCVVVLLVVLAGAAAHLYQPLLAARASKAGGLPALLVLGLWVAQWVFVRVRKARKRLAPAPAPKLAAAVAAAGKADDPPPGEDDKAQRPQTPEK